MGWQTPICQKGRRPLRKKYALRHLPNRSSATHFLRIGVRQPIFAESEFGNPFFLNSGYTYSREKPD